MKLSDLIPGVRQFKLAARLGPYAVIIGLSIAFVVMKASRDHHAEANDKHAQCVAAVGGNAPVSGLKEVCEQAIIDAAALAADGEAFRRCDAGLRGLVVGVPVICSGAVRALAADRDVKAGEVVQRDGQLALARIETTAAVDRAIRRERASFTRRAHADAAFAAAPRDADGLSVLDADGLCQLAGCAAAP